MNDEPMLDVEIKGHLTMLAMCARVACGIPTEALLKEFSYFDTMGPFIDPTRWRDVSDNARANQKVVRALVDFVKVVRAEWPDIDKKDLA